MNLNIDLALNKLYQREIVSREQILNEALRVKLTSKEIRSNNKDIKSKDKLFELMKKATEDELGFFPADRDDFVDIYEALKEIDLIDFALEIFKNDRMGVVISPSYLTDYIKEKIKKVNPKKILITEAEKHLWGLRELLKEYLDVEITLTTQSKPMYLLLKLTFDEYENIKIVFESIYSKCLEGEKFDYIYNLPTFGFKYEDIGEKFITRESDGIAMENMLSHLNDGGTLDIIVPAKVTFSGMEYGELRKFITKKYKVKSIFILPEGTFRPSTSIKTYLFTFTNISQSDIEIGTLKLNKEVFSEEDKKKISTEEFLSHEDWRVELLLSEDDENIKRFKNSEVEKVRLKDIAEVFRGKSILKKDTTVGSISILNISNIENGEIHYDNMDTIEEEERKIARYILKNNDVVLSCRGTAIKSAVFKEQNKIIIASANIIVIRPKEKAIGDYIKIFLESPTGMAIIKSFQRGTTVMNINHSDIMEMEIPLLPLSEQQKMIKIYNEELSIYKATVGEAENRWKKTKNNIYDKLI